MATTTYAIALGSNIRTSHGRPVATLRAALKAIDGVTVVSPFVESTAIGPSRRRYANAVALIETDEAPPALLARLKAIERRFGRRAGRRWGARTLDLDIVLWSGGRWTSRALIIPHAAFRRRAFVLAPLARVAPDWRDPVTLRTVRQLLHAVDRPRPRP